LRKSLEAVKPKGLNRIAKIGKNYLYTRIGFIHEDRLTSVLKKAHTEICKFQA